MTTREITGWVVFAVIVVLLILDTFMIVNKTHGDTISEIFLAVARRWPIIAFALGVVAGHLFWPQCPK